MFLVVLAREIAVSIGELGPLLISHLTGREMDLSADRPVALPYLKAAVAVSEGTRCAVLCHAECVGRESF